MIECEICVVKNVRLHVKFPVYTYLSVIKVVFTASTTVLPLMQKNKTPNQEAKTLESPKLKSKFTRVPKEKEPEPEVIKLKKVPVKPPEPEKHIITQKAEVTRHRDSELMVHGLHDREDREIVTLGRTERVFTAEEETVQLGYFEEAERVAVVQKTEKEKWTRTQKPQKEEEPEVTEVEKKKIIKLPRADEQNESVKLKPFEKSGRPEEELQKIKLKKVPPKAEEPVKEVITQKVEVTRHYDVEQTVQKLHDREDREVMTVQRSERIFTAGEEASDLSHMEEPEKIEGEDEKSKWMRTPKTMKDNELEPDISRKKIKKLPKKEREQDVVTLKPFEKPQKPDAHEPPKAMKGVEAATGTERISLKRGDTPQRDQATGAIKPRKDEEAPLTSPKVTPDVSKDQKEVPQRMKADQVPKEEEPTAANKPSRKARTIPTPDKEKEQVMLKPFTRDNKPEEKIDKASEEKKKEPEDTKVPSQTQRDESPKELKEQQLRKHETPEMWKKENEKPQEKEEKPVLATEKLSLSEKKEAERDIALKQTEMLKKGTELTKTSSPREGKDKVEEGIVLKPIEQLKTVELKKAPSPKVNKPKPEGLDNVPTEKKPSAEKVKQIPKTVSPKDSFEAVTLKKVPKKSSPEEASEPERPSKGRVPLVKEISPGAVHMKKVPTQPEEEVFEEEAEEMEGNEEEEAWGWELVPPEDWEGQGVDGALETPVFPGGKRGEMKADDII